MANNHSRNRNKRRPEVDNYIPPFGANQLGMLSDTLGLREETAELLKSAGLNTVLDIVKKCDTDFYRIPHFNKKNLVDLKNRLNANKLHLKPQVEPKAEEESANDAPVSNGTVATPVRQNAPQGQARKDGFNANRDGQNRDNQNRDSQPRDRRDNRPMQNNSYGINNSYGTNNRSPARSFDGREQNSRQNIQTLDRRNMNDRVRPDDVSEKRTKELKEKNRPKKTLAATVQDIYVKLNKGGKWGFSDRQGKIIVQPLFDEIYSFKDDICCVEVQERTGYINRNGEIVIEPQYECGSSFSEGMACVFKGGKCGYIDKENSVIVDFQFDAGTVFENGSCRVKRDGKWGELTITEQEDGMKKPEVRWII